MPTLTSSTVAGSDAGPGADRRRHARMALVRPAKVYQSSTARYWPAITQDVSPGGALLRVDAPRALTPGESLEVVVAWANRVLLSSKDLVPATVLRVLRDSQGRQWVAVAFAQDVPQAVPAQAA